jgi:hypothetical protein
MNMAKNKNFIRNALITIYILVVLGISATAKAQAEIPANVSSRLFTGELAMSTDSRFFLVVSDKEYYELQTSADLSALNGEMVLVEGIEPKRQIQPVTKLASFDPLDEAQNKPAPTLIVLGIRELTK